MDNTDRFEYTYSAPRNDEVRKIREKYLPKEETKLEQLRRLDASTAEKGLAYSLTWGDRQLPAFWHRYVLSILWTDFLMIPGIVIGCVGLAGMVLVYPLNRCITRKEQERLAPAILKLTNELMHRHA